jgi:pimeloyl-ACP methyl ester carboxylesterase
MKHPPIERAFLSYQQAEIEYHHYGTGAEILIILHGFSDRAGLFDVLAPALSTRYTVYALSLPYHGRTQWNADIFYPTDIAGIIRAILARTGSHTFTLMGYSMGGKIALNMVPVFAAQLHELILLAPDGIATHTLYDIHALPLWFIRFVKFLMKRPKTFFKVVRTAYAYRLISKFLFDFTINHFSTPEQRNRFFSIAASIHEFEPDLVQIKEQLNTWQTPVLMVLGERDEVILPVSAERFAQGLTAPFQAVFLPKGHLLVDADLCAFFQQRLCQATDH